MTAVIENETIATTADEVDEALDYSAFEAAVAQISLDDAKDDKSDAIKAAQEVYGNLNAKSKRAARKWLKDESERQMLDDNFDESKRLILIRKFAAVAPGKPAATTSNRKTETDKKIELFRSIHLAYQLIATEVQNIEGVDFTAIQPTDVDLTPALAYMDWIKSGDADNEPDVSKELKRAARIASGRGPNGQGRKPRAKVEEVIEDDAPAAE